MHEKLRKSSLLVGAVIKSSASTLAGSSLIPSALNIMPQKLISLLAKLHFSGTDAVFVARIRSSCIKCAFSIDISYGFKATLSSPCGGLMSIVR